jgi:integrase
LSGLGGGVGFCVGRPQFPYVVEKGSVKVRIYHSVTRGKYHNYTLAYYQDGARKRPVFSDFKKAKQEALFVAKRLGSKDADVLELKSSDRAAYQRARELLDPLGVGVEMAAAQFADAKTRLGDVPLSRAVDFYLQERPKVKVARTVPEVVAELCDAKEIDRLSHVYLKHLRYNLGKFAGHFKGSIEEVKGPEIDSWLRGLGLSARSRNNIRTALGTLYNFARGRRYLPRDHHELEAVPIAKQPVGPIGVFTPAELVEVLCFTEERLIPFMVLGAFAGVRHSEVLRLNWKDVRLEEGFVEVAAAKAKTASRRLVPITPNLREWLVSCGRNEGPVCELLSVAPEIHDIVVRMNRARRAKWGDGFQPFKWRQNGLRHSFISYRVAAVQNADQVALEAGNSRQMVFSNYRELVTPKAAQQWFGITPEIVEQAKRRNVVGSGCGGGEASGGAAGARG